MDSITEHSFWFPEPVHAAMARRDAVATGAELFTMDAGFRALWVGEDKRPYGTLTPGGVHDATDDPIVLRQWAYLFPDSSLAIVQPPWTASIDIDDPSVHVDGVPAGTWTERTVRGLHHLVKLPAPLPRSRKLPGGAGDLLVGQSSYVIISPSVGRVPIDVAAPVLPLDPLSPLCSSLQPEKMGDPLDPMQVTPADFVSPRIVLDRLLARQHAEGISALFSRDWRRRRPDWSESERDAALVLAGTHLVRDEPRAKAVLYALLWQTGWPQNPHRANP